MKQMVRVEICAKYEHPNIIYWAIQRFHNTLQNMLSVYIFQDYSVQR